MLELWFGTRLFIIYSELKVVAMSSIFSKVVVANFFFPMFLILECFKAKVRS